VSFVYRSLFDISYNLFEPRRIAERIPSRTARSAHTHRGHGRGLISGHWRRENIAPGDFRAHSPRFQGANVETNLALVEALRKVAAAKNISVAQLAIAWVAQQGNDIIPLIGARRRDRLAEALGSVHVALAASDLAAIEIAVPKDSAAGARYPAAAMADLDSEN
jgi:aryl-alcohol dehydrogenase-like predicted oxidoreductase